MRSSTAGRSCQSRVSSRGTSTIRSYIGRSNAFQGAVSSTSSKSVSAPVTHPGTTSTHAPRPRNRRRAPDERRVEVGRRRARAGRAAR